jgi:hypothetical protein
MTAPKMQPNWATHGGDPCPDYEHLDDEPIGKYRSMWHEPEADPAMANYKALAVAIVQQSLQDILDRAKAYGYTGAVALAQATLRSSQVHFWADVAGLQLPKLVAGLLWRLRHAKKTRLPQLHPSGGCVEALAEDAADYESAAD